MSPSEQVKKGVWEEMRLVVSLRELQVGQRKMLENGIQCWGFTGKRLEFMRGESYLDHGTSSEWTRAWVSISGNKFEKAGSNEVSL